MNEILQSEGESPFRIFLQTSAIAIIIIAYVVSMTVNPPDKQERLKYNVDKELLEKRLKNFKPEPIVPKLNEQQKAILDYLRNNVVDNVKGSEISLPNITKGKSLHNFADQDYFGFGQKEEVKEAAVVTLKNYGVGSCGPRTFYGTHDVHLVLEKTLKQFFGSEDCVVYSDSFSTVSSILGVFSKRNDILLVDRCCNEAILNGCQLSRSKIIFFEHNDIDDLQQKIQSLQKDSESKVTIVVEGLYKLDGTVSPLVGICDLKRKYDCRLFVDESLSFGVLGETGKGLTEECGLKIGEDVNFFVASLDTFCCSIGGFCVGNKEVVLHQRLMGAGYIYSAAVSPFLSMTACASLNLLENDLSVSKELKRLSVLFTETFDAADCVKRNVVKCPSAANSPIKHVFFSSISAAKDSYYKVREAQLKLAEKEDVYCALGLNGEGCSSMCSLKVVLTLYHMPDDIVKLVKTLNKIFSES
eukprot:snap_masked-scaffold_11-processed-gene-2.4-mRNA-1 protein AED:0.26 eAED:0.26 QI:0/-1/0/1/-1/1/1/0/470